MLKFVDRVKGRHSLGVAMQRLILAWMGVKKEHVCLECEEKLYGRADKKFCSDACRNVYNYRTNATDHNFVRNVVAILKRNRKVLSELNTRDEGVTTVHRDKLVQKGFSFTYHTHTYTTKAGKVYVFCFEHGYLDLEDDRFTLVRRDEQ